MKPRIFLAIVVVLLSLTSCSLLNGRDGLDGKPFITYWYNQNDVDYHNISTTDPAFKDIERIQPTMMYLSTPGTYTFQYTTTETYLSPSKTWSGKYTLTRVCGTDGTFLKDGDNGHDTFFELELNIDGPEFYADNVLQESEKGITINENKGNSYEVVINEETETRRYEILKSDLYVVVFEANLQ